MKEKLKKHERLRLFAQCLSFAFHNGYLQGWTKSGLYTGKLKTFCVPGLNCYSCPGAVGSCPLGSLQAVLDSGTYHFSLYVLGFIGLVGMFCGRLICGWLCPFGWIQDLMYRIPLFKKLKNLPGHKYLRYLRYGILAVFVVLLPMTVLNVAGKGQPWFCEWICPAGTLLGGIPQLILTPQLRNSVGFRFFWKLGILLLVLIASIKFARPFCKYVCPLGALYGLCNPVSVYRLQVDADKCVSCGSCQRACPVDLKTWENPNSMDCIRCGRCKAACPQNAISTTLDSFLSSGKAAPETPIAETPVKLRSGKGRKILSAVLLFLFSFWVVGLEGYMAFAYFKGGIVTEPISLLMYILMPFLFCMAGICNMVTAVTILSNAGKPEENARLSALSGKNMLLTFLIGVVLLALTGILMFFGLNGVEELRFSDISEPTLALLKAFMPFYASPLIGSFLAWLLMRGRKTAVPTP